MTYTLENLNDMENAAIRKEKTHGEKIMQYRIRQYKGEDIPEEKVDKEIDLRDNALREILRIRDLRKKLKRR